MRDLMISASPSRGGRAFLSFEKTGDNNHEANGAEVSRYRIVVRITHQAFYGEATKLISDIFKYVTRETGCDTYVLVNCRDFTVVVNVYMSAAQQKKCTETTALMLCSELNSHCVIDMSIYLDGGVVLAPNEQAQYFDGSIVYNRQIPPHMLRQPVEIMLVTCSEAGPFQDFTAPAGVFMGDLGSDARTSAEPIEIYLADITKLSYSGKRVRCKAVYINRITTRHIPKCLEKKCISQSEACKSVGCPYYTADTVYVKSSDEIIVRACDGKSSQMSVLLKHWFCPRAIKNIKIAIIERQQVSQIAVNPYVDRSECRGTVKPQVVYYVGENPPESGLVEFTGTVVLTERMQPVLLAESWHPFAERKRVISTAGFEAFQNIAPEMILDSILRSIGIRGKQVQLLIDLLWLHSPRKFWFNGRLIKGLLDFCEIGDTGQAKTLRRRRLNEFLGWLFEIVDCHTSTRSGVLYCIRAIKGVGEYIELGMIPLSNGGAVFLDEIQAFDPDSFIELRSVRSNQILSVNRRTKGNFPAEVRLFMVGNPRNGKAIRDYPYPACVLRELMPEPDIRRFDLVVQSSCEDVDPLKQNEPNTQQENEPEIISGDLLSRSILSAWQLEPDQIGFNDGVEALIFEEARRLSDKYMVHDVPLALSSDLHEKIARLAVAYATTFHSTNPDHTQVIVRREHVLAVTALMDTLYSGPNMRLDGYAALKKKATLTDQLYQAVSAWLTIKSGHRDNLELSVRLIELLANECPISRIEIMERLQILKDALALRMAFLQRQGLVIVQRSMYEKTALLQQFYDRWINERGRK